MYRIYTDDKLIHDPNLITEGYGVLSPKLTLEINKAGSLEFVMPPSHELYNKLSKLKSELVVYDDDEILFKGRVLNDEKDFYNQKKVYVEGQLAYLLDSIIRPYASLSNGDYKGTPKTWLDYYLARHNEHVRRGPNSKTFTGIVEHEKQDSGELFEFTNDTHATTFDEINEKLINTFGGYLMLDHSGTIIPGQPDILLWRTEGKSPKSDQVIEFGVNLLDIMEHISGEDIYTVLVPTYTDANSGDKKKITVWDDNANNRVDYIEDKSAVDLFGVIERYEDVGEFTLDTHAIAEARGRLKNNIKLKTTITLKAIDLHLINVDIKRIHLGDMVRVVSLPHGIDTELQCTKIVYDLVNPDQNEYTFGHNLETLTEKQVKSQKNKNKYSSVGEQPIAATTMSLNNTASGTETTSILQGGTE